MSLARVLQKRELRTIRKRENQKEVLVVTDRIREKGYDINLAVLYCSSKPLLRSSFHLLFMNNKSSLPVTLMESRKGSRIRLNLDFLLLAISLGEAALAS